MIKTHANHKAEIALPLSEMTNIEITLINFHLPVKILRTNLAVLSPVSLNTTVFFSGFVLPDCQHLRTLSIIPQCLKTVFTWFSGCISGYILLIFCVSPWWPLLSPFCWVLLISLTSRFWSTLKLSHLISLTLFYFQLPVLFWVFVLFCFLFLVRLGFELRASHLQSRHFTA
jgi:hypothetical protein